MMETQDRRTKEQRSLTPRENSLLVSGMANMWGWPRAQNSLTKRPSVMAPRAPPLVKSYLSKINFMKRAADKAKLPLLQT